MAQLNSAALLTRRRSILTNLRTVTASRLSAGWRRLDNYTDEERWAELAGPVVEASQRRAVSVQIAYLQNVLGDTIDFDMDAVLERAAVDLREPFIGFANALDKGAEFADAVTSGALRAEGIGESSVTWAQRSACSEVDGDKRIVGWTRALSSDPCEWCQVVATQRYATAESASFGHTRCNCEPTEIIGDRDPGRVLNQQTLSDLRESGAVQRANESRERGRARERAART